MSVVTTNHSLCTALAERLQLNVQFKQISSSLEELVLMNNASPERRNKWEILKYAKPICSWELTVIIRALIVLGFIYLKKWGFLSGPAKENQFSSKIRDTALSWTNLFPLWAIRVEKIHFESTRPSLSVVSQKGSAVPPHHMQQHLNI